MGKHTRKYLLVAMALLSMPETLLAQEEYVYEECKDVRRACRSTAKEGNCKRQPELMHRVCPESCKVCELMDRTQEFGVKQELVGFDAFKVSKRVKETQKYIDSDFVLNLPPEIFLNCWNRHAQCSRWALAGECENNKEWMDVNCSPACKSCQNLTMDQIERLGIEENASGGPSPY